MRSSLVVSLLIGGMVTGMPVRAQHTPVRAQHTEVWRTVDAFGVQLSAGSHLRALNGNEQASKGAGYLVKIHEHLYQTEHALFIIDDGRIQWPDYSSVFSFDNVRYYFDTFFEHFPEDVTTIVVVANNLEPNYVPNYYPSSFKALGIGDDRDDDDRRSFDFCRYNVGGGLASQVNLSVFDHEIGHGWGVFLPPNREHHWTMHSTVYGQMAERYIPVAATVQYIVGDETNGFEWREIWNSKRNEEQTYSLQQLYVMGLQPTYPDTYLLHDPVYNPDGSVSYSSFEKYDHASITAEFGPRTPDYRSSEKRFKLGFIYVGRSYREIVSAAAPLEASIRHFTYAEEIDLKHHLYEVPFLVASRFRGSADARLSDLNGNISPTLRFEDSHVTVEKGGTASLAFEALDAEGQPLALSCLAYAERCEFGQDVLRVGPLDTTGTYFITAKAVDAGGKMVFAHTVVDVQGAATTIDDEAGGVAPAFAVLSNHPNPFQTLTTFTVELSKPAFVRLKVYDMLGREVETVFSANFPAGRIEKAWKPLSSAAGTYVAMLQAGEHTETRLLTVWK